HVRLCTQGDKLLAVRDKGRAGGGLRVGKPRPGGLWLYVGGENVAALALILHQRKVAVEGDKGHLSALRDGGDGIGAHVRLLAQGDELLTVGKVYVARLAAVSWSRTAAVDLAGGQAQAPELGYLR